MTHLTATLVCATHPAVYVLACCGGLHIVLAFWHRCVLRGDK